MADEIDPGTLRRFAAGDDDAFAELYRRYAGPMFAIASQIVGRRELAADAVQQAFIQAWRAASKFDANSDPAPWLFTIARRAAIDVYRKERRHVVADIDAGEEPTVPGPSMESAWEAWEVRRALDALPADERDVVRLTYLGGLTHAEAATHLAIPVGTVKSRTHRAQRRLGDLLAHLRESVAPQAALELGGDG